MRRVLFALAAGLLLFCCGCQNNTDDKTATPIADAFSATVAISQGAFSYTAEISKRADGTFVTTLKEPAALNGLTITQTADNCSFAFAGLNLQTPPSLLPDAAFQAVCKRRSRPYSTARGLLPPNTAPTWFTAGGRKTAIILPLLRKKTPACRAHWNFPNDS